MLDCELLDPLLYIFHNVADYDPIQTLKCVSIKFISNNDFWPNFYNRIKLANIFEEDIVECTHLDMNEQYDSSWYRLLWNQSDNRILRRKRLPEVHINKNPMMGSMGIRGEIDQEMIIKN